tara:strand:+ start:2010 stop:2354 length:345 start_codon:yes stop_codon:yes gene_type:complete
MNTQDQKLLEMAARAAGAEKVTIQLYNGLERDSFWLDSSEWNPIEDDSDAFRLAVELGIGFIPDYEVGEVNTTYMIGRYGYNTNEEFESCPLSATRRAIVRAAAAIGKQLEGKV